MGKRRAKWEGSIYQRKDGLWVGQITYPDGRRKYKYAKTRRDVREWLQKEQSDVSKGIIVID